jgi:hypothetical protein
MQVQHDVFAPSWVCSSIIVSAISDCKDEQAMQNDTQGIWQTYVVL